MMSLDLDIENFMDRDEAVSDDDWEKATLGEWLEVKENLTVIGDAFPGIVRLHLSLYCTTFAEGAMLISAFPLLEMLELNSDWFVGNEECVPEDMISLPSLLRNTDCTNDCSRFFLWLLRQPNPPPVSTLWLRNTYITDPVRSYIQTVGASLRHLSFIHPPIYLAKYIDLSHNIGLRSVAIYPQEDTIFTVWQFLSQVHSTEVEKIEIGLSDDGSTFMDLESREHWWKLDRLLATPQFSNYAKLR
jgi:hypothetical protein